MQQPPECAGWQARWRDKLKLKPTPVASVLMTGAWEILDHVADGSTVSFGTPEWTALVRHAVDDAIRTLGSARAPVFVFDAPCYPNRNTTLPLPERTDPRRIKAFNEILANGGRSVTRTSTSSSSTPPCCARGRHLESVHAGKDIWQGDGVHLNGAGAVFVWRCAPSNAADRRVRAELSRRLAQCGVRRDRDARLPPHDRTPPRARDRTVSRSRPRPAPLHRRRRARSLDRPPAAAALQRRRPGRQGRSRGRRPPHRRVRQREGPGARPPARGHRLVPR